MGLLDRAAVVIPFWTAANNLDNQTFTLLGASDHSPGISVVTGVDLCVPGFFETANALVRTVSTGPGTTVFFQAQVYAQSQASFSWRGEMPLFDGTSVQVVANGGPWDVTVWGAVIPGSAHHV